MTQEVKVLTVARRLIPLQQTALLLPQTPPKVVTTPTVPKVETIPKAETIPKEAAVLNPVAMERDRMIPVIKTNPATLLNNQLQIAPDQDLNHNRTHLMQLMELKELQDRTVPKHLNRMALTLLSHLRTVAIHQIVHKAHSRMALKANKMDLIQLETSQPQTQAQTQPQTHPVDLLNRRELSNLMILIST